MWLRKWRVFFFLDFITNRSKCRSFKQHLVFFQIVLCCVWGSYSWSVSRPQLGAARGEPIRDGCLSLDSASPGVSHLCRVVQASPQLDSQTGREVLQCLEPDRGFENIISVTFSWAKLSYKIQRERRTEPLPHPHVR